MNITKEQIRAAGGIVHSDGNIFFTNIDQLNSIMRGLAEDAELLALFAASQKQLPLDAVISATSPQAAQTEAQEREEFEAWWDSGTIGCSNSGPWVHNKPIQWAWDAWRAGRKG